MDEDRLLTLPEAAKILGVNRGTVYGWIKKGYLNPVKLPDGRKRIARSEVDRFILKLDTKNTYTSQFKILYTEKDVNKQ